jgi:hypothetical protein
MSPIPAERKKIISGDLRKNTDWEKKKKAIDVLVLVENNSKWFDGKKEED